MRSDLLLLLLSAEDYTDTVSLSGVGALTPVGIKASRAGVAVSGAGALAPAGRKAPSISISISGAGGGTAAGRKGAASTPSLSGTAALVAAGVKSTTGDAACSAIGGFASTYTATHPGIATGTASISASAGIAATGTKGAGGSASISATGALAAAGARGTIIQKSGATSLSAQGIILSTGQKGAAAGAALASSGVTAAGGRKRAYGDVELVGVGSLVGTGGVAALVPSTPALILVLGQRVAQALLEIPAGDAAVIPFRVQGPDGSFLGLDSVVLRVKTDTVVSFQGRLRADPTYADIPIPEDALIVAGSYAGAIVADAPGIYNRHTMPITVRVVDHP